MRTAFLFAATSVLIAVGLTAAGAGVPFLVLGWVAAATLMVLWLGHIVMVSSHAVLALPRTASGAAMPRRRFLLVFLRTLIFAAAVTSLPRSLRAQSCNCYSDSDCYCPPDFPQCVFNPSTGEAICCGADNNGCAGPTLTWCCPPGSQCYGTDAQCMSN
jgi:hypothetical protein